MGELHRTAQHVLHRCTRVDEWGRYCFVCEGGLACCEVCGGGESSLPTDCPGAQMTDEQLAAVTDGELDYDRRRGWIERDASIHASLIYEPPRSFPRGHSARIHLMAVLRLARSLRRRGTLRIRITEDGR